MSFWKTKKLIDMTIEEWESLCDNCGKCCLNKLEDEESGEIYFTSAACKLLNIATCRCSHYQERTHLVPECIDLKQHDFAAYNWLPATCAYRLLANGEPLPAWHPLESGRQGSVQEAGESVSAYAVNETEVDDLEDYILDWLM